MIIELETDGRTLWINSESGMCLGRFGPMGVDVHKESEAQLRGETPCLMCTHGKPGLAEWVGFQEAMLINHCIIIDDDLLPNWLKAGLH